MNRGIAFRISEIYKEEGLGGLCLRALRKASRLVFDTNSAIWFEKDLSQNLPEQNITIPLDINLSAPQETISWIKNQGERWMYNPQEIKIGLQENHYFANAKYNGNIIGYCRIGIGKAYIADYKKAITLEPGTAFICDTYVIPEFRSRGIATFLKVKLMQELRRQGFKKIRNHVPAWNISSLKVSEKLGFKKVFYARHIRILGFLKFYFRKEYA